MSQALNEAEEVLKPNPRGMSMEDSERLKGIEQGDFDVRAAVGDYVWFNLDNAEGTTEEDRENLSKLAKEEGLGFIEQEPFAYQSDQKEVQDGENKPVGIFVKRKKFLGIPYGMGEVVAKVHFEGKKGPTIKIRHGDEQGGDLLEKIGKVYGSKP